MARVKWKRTRRGIVFVEKKTWSEKLQSLTFMQTALALFAVEVVAMLGCLVWAIASNGRAAWPIILLGFLIFVLGCGGVWVTCYGHYTVGAESRIPWKTGIYTNGIMLLLMVAVYILGLVAG